MNRPDPKQSVRELLEEAHPALVGLSHWIHANPEVGFEEHHASDWVNEWLQTAGFEVERGVADMPTALIGRFGPGPFHVAICVEYDALPEVGHACGHNIIAAAGVGAGLALASVADELGLQVSVMGTPAEESGGGKLAFIEAGYFGDVHAAAMIHPWPSDIVTPNIIAITQLDVTYTGHEAHAAGFPHRGRNAADAMIIAQTAIGLLRQQLLPTDRVHGIITKGGDAPNIIPALTTARFMVRAQDRERLEVVTGLVRRCFEAGALATGTDVEVVEGTAYANMVHDPDLAALYHHNAEQLGRVFDSDPGAPLSTDMGDVSHVVPSIHPTIGIASNGAVNHQREFAEACATPSADRAILDGALGLAWTVIDAAQSQVIRARLMGEAVIREAVAIVEEVEELDAHAGVLEDLAGTVAASDPELAEQITAAAEALESRADELAEEADVRFEQAQELADEALLDEVTGELESDVEDIVANIETTPFVGLEDAGVETTGDEVGLAQVVGFVALTDDRVLAAEGSGSTDDGWEPAEPVVAQAEDDATDPSAGILTDIWGGDTAESVEAVAESVEAVAESDGEPVEAVAESAWEPSEASVEAVAESGPEPAEAVAESAWEPSEASVEAVAESVEQPVEAVAGSEADQTEGQPEVTSVAAMLSVEHAAWERDYQIVARHAMWEEQFAASTSEAEPVEAVAQAESQPADAGSEAGWEQPVAESESQPVDAGSEAGWEQPVAGSEAEPVEAIADASQESVEAVAESESQPVDAGSEAGWEQPVAGSDAEPVEAIADASQESVEAVAESEPQPVEAGSEAGWDQPVAGSDADPVEAVAEAGWHQASSEVPAEGTWEPTTADESADPGSVRALAESDDIWYSGAPDDELPAAELVPEEPVGVGAPGEGSETFVWIPAEDERR